MASAPLPAIIPAPREPFVDPRTGTISRTWNNFLGQIQRNLGGTITAVILTADDSTASYPNSVILTPVAGQLERLLDPSSFTIGLADTTITPGTYGSATEIASVQFDAKGRAVAAQEHNVRAAFSGAGQIDVDASTGVISATGFSTTLSGGPVTQLSLDGGIVTGGSVEPGFTGSGPFTSFTFVDGVCTEAS